VQVDLQQRDMCMGHKNTLNIGIAATYIEIKGVEPKSFDLDDKRQHLVENRRKDVDVDQLLHMIDEQHIETIGVLQWLCTLTNYVPELTKWKEHVSILYRTRAAKLPLPAQATKVLPLAASGKKETITVELKDALLNFLNSWKRSKVTTFRGC
jgi:hypothetical protein